MIMNKTIITLLVLIIPLLSFSQEKVIDNQFNSWWTYGGTHKINENYGLHTIASFRRNDFVNDWQQTLVRVGINRKISSNVTFGIGGDWATTWPYGEQPIGERTTEYRTYERIELKQNVNKLALKQRFNLEQRYVNDNTLHRLRYRFTMSHPLSEQLSFVAFDEVFLHLGSRFYGKNFNQNWAYLGLKYKVGKGSISLGYMNQFLVKGDRLRAESNHTLSVGYGYNFDFSK